MKPGAERHTVRFVHVCNQWLSMTISHKAVQFCTDDVATPHHSFQSGSLSRNHMHPDE